MADTVIRPAGPGDAAEIARIYNHYVLHTTVSFEEATVAPDDIARRLAAVRDAGLPWLACEQAGSLAGYAYATPWRPRSAYRFSVESSIYLDPGCHGRGLGTRLYAALFDELRALGCHAVMGGITLPNPASVALHEKLGMMQVAHFREVGFKFGQWLDTGYWQRLLP